MYRVKDRTIIDWLDAYGKSIGPEALDCLGNAVNVMRLSEGVKTISAEDMDMYRRAGVRFEDLSRHQGNGFLALAVDCYHLAGDRERARSLMQQKGVEEKGLVEALRALLQPNQP